MVEIIRTRKGVVWSILRLTKDCEPGKLVGFKMMDTYESKADAHTEARKFAESDPGTVYQPVCLGDRLCAEEVAVTKVVVLEDAEAVA
jgi:hypothetical protein